MLIHVTDGVPRELSEALSAGFANREQYACARRRELDRALAAASVSHERRLAFREADQESVFHLADLTRELIPIGRAPQRLEFASYHARDG